MSSNQRWTQTAHGRVLLMGLGWLAVLLVLVIALRLPSISGGEQSGWRLMGSLALWMVASPVVGLIGLALALVSKVPEGSRTTMRVASIVVHVVILALSAALFFNSSRG